MDVTAENVLTMVQSSVVVDVISPDIYGTVSRGNRYFDNRLRSFFWTDSSTDDKKKALIEATRIVDSLNYVGEKTDGDQLHQFPRDGDTAVPADVEVATYEIAIQLLSGVDPDIEVENLTATGQGFSSARTNFDRQFALEHIAQGVPSVKAWRILKSYLRDSRKLVLQRVN